MTLSEVKAAYEAMFEDKTIFSLFLETDAGKNIIKVSVYFFIAILVFAVIFSVCHWAGEKYGISAKKIDIAGVFVIIPIIAIYVFIGMNKPMTFALLFMNKDYIIVEHPEYEKYVEEYVEPYLRSLPDKRYEFEIKHVEESGLYLTHTDVDDEPIEKEKQFNVRDLEYVLIDEGESRYVSEVSLEDDLGVGFRAGYKWHVAYINETDRKIIEEYLGYEIDIGQN